MWGSPKPKVLKQQFQRNTVMRLWILFWILDLLVMKVDLFVKRVRHQPIAE